MIGQIKHLMAHFKIKFEYTDKDGFFLSTTVKRSNLIKDQGYIIKKHTGNNVKIITGDLKNHSDKLFLLKDYLSLWVCRVFEPDHAYYFMSSI